MPALQFLPWCHLDKDYLVGDIALKRFRRDEPMEGVDALTTARIRLVLSSYKSISGFPVRHAVVIQVRDHGLLDDLTDDEYAISSELGQVAAFTGLANREFFTQLAKYCNSDHFRLYRQMFEEEPTRTSLINRRPDGHSMNSVRVAELAISKPTHADTLEVKLDEHLLTALVDHRRLADRTEWARWQNAITCFNAGNTDESPSLFQVEWVLLVSAFEHMLAARPQKRDVARLLTDKLRCDDEVPAATARRNTRNWPDNGQPLRFEWMQEFYRVRGDFAHGTLETKQALCWQPHEHLLLAKIAFPLLIRCLLADAGRYVLTEDDETQLSAFERFADGDFFSPDNSPLSDKTPLWQELLQEGRNKASTKRMREWLDEELAKDGDEQVH